MYPIFITNGGGGGWLKKRVNLSLIFNHTASSFVISAPSLMTSATGFFWFRSLLAQSNVIPLMIASMVGIRHNIRIATAQDIRIARYSIARLININTLTPELT